LATPPVERSLAAKIAAHKSWARTENPSARTAPARMALENKFLAEAGGDLVRAEHIRAAYYAGLALKSAQARRKAKEARARADLLDREALDAETALGGDVA
jgi:hypothetical protein